jgi:hypothetical protein
VCNTTILRFNVGVPAGGFAGIELNQSAYNSIAGNNVIGALANTETGILISAAGTSSNTVIGNTTTNINGAGIWCAGNSTFNTVVGNNLVGGTGIVQDTVGNLIDGNMWNGYVFPSPNLYTSGMVGYDKIGGGALPVSRWFVGLDTTVAESGSNTGSNFQVVAAADNGSLLGAPITISRASGIATFHAYGGNATHIAIDALAGAGGNVLYSNAGAARWFVGTYNTEGGSNTGADFEFVRVGDTGTLLGTALSIARSTGYITLGTIPLNAANDAAAAAAGVPIGGLYRSASALMVRVV